MPAPLGTLRLISVVEKWLEKSLCAHMTGKAEVIALDCLDGFVQHQVITLVTFRRTR
jgi:hypothetical protein